MKALLLILFLITGLSGGSKDKAREANKAYREGDFAKAEQGYRAALKEDPENAKLLFNLGNALAQQHKYEEALEKFDTFTNMVNDPDAKARALYNMGNIFANQKKWDKALDYYKKSLKMNAGDKETKYNYELAYKHQKQNKHNKNQGKNNQKNQNKNSKNNQNRKNNKQQNPNQQNKSGNKNQQPPQNKNNQSQSQNQKMSRQEAEKILSALQDQENNLLKQLRKQKTKSDSKKNAKDW